MLKDFRQFILRGNVVDLAIAVVIGASFNSVVQSFVTNVITPLIAVVGGKPDLAGYALVIHHTVFSYGTFLNQLISFVLTATVVFFFVVQPVNRLMSLVKGDQPTIPTTRACPECKSDIPVDATRCKFCTSKVKPIESTKQLEAKLAADA